MENDIKHFIITRFLNVNFNNCSDELLFNDDKLNYLFDMLNTHFIPTLENQTNKNFEAIILIHNNININKINNLFNKLNTKLNIKILRTNELTDYVYSYYNKFNKIITSRIDCDDLINKKAIEELHNFAKTIDKFSLFGYGDGATLVDKEKDVYYMPKLNYAINKEGFIAILESLIIDTNFITKPTTIYNLGNHTEIINKLKNNPSILGLSNIDFECFKYIDSDLLNNDIKYIYIKHNKSDSSLRGIKIIHYSDIIIKNIKLKEEFGYIY